MKEIRRERNSRRQWHGSWKRSQIVPRFLIEDENFILSARHVVKHGAHVLHIRAKRIISSSATLMTTPYARHAFQHARTHAYRRPCDENGRLCEAQRKWRGASRLATGAREFPAPIGQLARLRPNFDNFTACAGHVSFISSFHISCDGTHNWKTSPCVSSHPPPPTIVKYKFHRKTKSLIVGS